MESDSGQPLNNRDIVPFRKPRRPQETFKKSPDLHSEGPVV
uniref:Transmembrane protease, serine 4 n=1 Tax=Mus musculus TaxID=10090 RepID=E9Q4A7_MOUSE